MGTNILEVRGIAKALGGGGGKYPTQIIGDLSFAAPPGEFISIVGPSGCGKTTLLMCLAGLLRVDQGEVVFEDKLVTAPPPGMGVVFQDYSRSLLPWRRNVANVVFGMKRLEGVSAAEKEAQARELLQHVGLKGFEDYYPWQVSGGMQQRVAIARALAAQSRLLLLDEPLAAVDAQTRAEVQDLLLAVAAEYRQTCVLVTHDVDEALYLATRVIVLSQRPTRVLRDIRIDLPTPRDQLHTRAHPDFLRMREEVLTLIKSLPKPG
ncbi:MAG TPA: ABC transporter ATP-binding protein [Rubrivivax sp.]|nr:ABC transporter ATP-binding protein [Rubrivivax sp.]